MHNNILYVMQVIFVFLMDLVIYHIYEQYACIILWMLNYETAKCKVALCVFNLR